MSSRGCAGHRANLASLFETLNTVVCPTSNNMPAKDLCLSAMRDYEEIFLQCSEFFDSEDM